MLFRSLAAIPWCFLATALLIISVPAGKLMSMPHGMISVVTNVCAQYTWPIGSVATRILPVKKASILMSITHPGPIREMTWPVVTAAMKPEIATGQR